MKRLIESLPSGVRVNGVAVVSALALGWAAIALVGELPSILGATFAPTSGSVEQEPFREALDEHQKLVEDSRKRFDGRSMFFAPPAPRPPRASGGSAPACPGSCGRAHGPYAGCRSRWAGAA